MNFYYITTQCLTVIFLLFPAFNYASITSPTNPTTAILNNQTFMMHDKQNSQEEDKQKRDVHASTLGNTLKGIFKENTNLTTDLVLLILDYYRSHIDEYNYQYQYTRFIPNQLTVGHDKGKGFYYNKLSFWAKDKKQLLVEAYDSGIFLFDLHNALPGNQPTNITNYEPGYHCNGLCISPQGTHVAILQSNCYLSRISLVNLITKESHSVPVHSGVPSKYLRIVKDREGKEFITVLTNTIHFFKIIGDTIAFFHEIPTQNGHYYLTNYDISPQGHVAAICSLPNSYQTVCLWKSQISNNNNQPPDTIIEAGPKRLVGIKFSPHGSRLAVTEEQCSLPYPSLLFCRVDFNHEPIRVKIHNYEERILLVSDDGPIAITSRNTYSNDLPAVSLITYSYGNEPLEAETLALTGWKYPYMSTDGIHLCISTRKYVSIYKRNEYAVKPKEHSDPDLIKQEPKPIDNIPLPQKSFFQRWFNRRNVLWYTGTTLCLGAAAYFLSKLYASKYSHARA